MQNILIRPNESGTIIPKCGLDSPTDKIRKLFGVSIHTFQTSFSSASSPARWLYYILSNQQHIQAKVHTLETHLARTKENCTKQSIHLRTKIHEASGSLPESEIISLNEKLNRFELLTDSLTATQKRLHIPKEQLEQLKTLRLKKITEFSPVHTEYCNEVKLALLAGGFKSVSNATLSQVMAYFISLAPLKKTRRKLNPDIIATIEDAVAPNLPSELRQTILNILTKPDLWKILKLKQPSLPVSMELYPVLIRLLREFDKFRVSHAGLIAGIEKLKESMKSHEQSFTSSILNAQNNEVLDSALIEAYPAVSPQKKTSPDNLTLGA